MDDREGGNDPRTSRKPDRFTSRQNFWDLAKIVKSVASQCDVNACIGAAVGLVFLVIGGPKEWMLPIALAVTVLLSTYGGRIPVMWRQAPITAAIFVASGVAHQSKLSGIDQGLHKVAEVIFGCGAGIAVSWLMSRVWPVVPANEAATAARPGA